MLDLITQSKTAVDELIDLAGRATIEDAQRETGKREPNKESRPLFPFISPSLQNAWVDAALESRVEHGYSASVSNPLLAGAW